MDEFIKFFSEIKVAIGSFFMAFIVAGLRTKRDGDFNWVESTICGLLGMSVWFLVSWFNIPEMAAVGIASFMGCLGSHWITEIVKSRMEK